MATDPDVRHLSIAIARSSRDVYDYASNPRNLPQWAHGLAGSIQQVDGEWVADSPMGKVRVRFAEPNDFGVLDHVVTLESGVSVRNPMRVVERGPGRSELIFTVFRQPNASDAAFEADASAVERDLRTIKQRLE